MLAWNKGAWVSKEWAGDGFSWVSRVSSSYQYVITHYVNQHKNNWKCNTASTALFTFPPLVVFLGSQFFKGKFRVSTNKFLLAVHNDLLDIRFCCRRRVCGVFWFRNHDHPLFPTGENTSFTQYTAGTLKDTNNGAMHWLYLRIWLFSRSWRNPSRTFWTLKDKTNTSI